ncbi:CotH kinase family protein [Crocinitomix catalasitica]|uniref:CotH kinase family protein n=1 Tax=Crocinitomix catalasitica TaxID=184607 RepID=UPI0012F8DEAF|nr:CotH kinase family protein [Crocinitomix catalasitica]
MFKKTLTILCLSAFALSSLGQILTTPFSNRDAGIFTSAFELELNHLDDDVVIFYTINGNDPTVSDIRYTRPILIDNRTGVPNSVSLIPTNPSLTYPFGTYNASRATTRGWVPPAEETYKINVIRYRAFKPGYAPSPTVTQSFMVDPLGAERYSFPIVSLNIDYEDIFSNESGYYVYGNEPDGNYSQKGEEWERIIHIEYFDVDGTLLMDRDARSRVHGGGSRHAPKKTLRMYGETGEFTNFNLEVFSSTEQDKFKRLLFKGGGHRLDCFPRDDLANSITKGLNVDQQNHKHVIVFLNGEYWGIHSIKERMDNYFFQNIYGIDDNDLSVLDQEYNIQSGGIGADSAAMEHLEDYMDINDMSDPIHYQHIAERIDIENYIDYMCGEIFLSNEDWVYSNVVMWRKSGPLNPSLNSPYDGKFRWAYYDLDGAFGGSCNNAFYTVNTLAAATITEGIFSSYSEFFRDLLENEDFKIKFINRMSDLTNSWFKPETLHQKIHATYETLSPEMLENVNRWRYPSTAGTLEARYEEAPSLSQWYLMQEYFNRFASRRPGKVREHIMLKWDYPDTNKLTIDVNDQQMGTVQVNSIQINRLLPGVDESIYPWVGTYIDSIQLPLIAIAKPGYRFVEWAESGNTNDTIYWMPSGDSTFTAVFTPEDAYNSILINEVMLSNDITIPDNYGDFDDWSELYNPNDNVVDLSGCEFVKSGIRWTIPNGTKIGPNDYLIYWHDKETYQGKSHINFKLTNQIDTLFLFDSNGDLMDQVRYPVTPTDLSYGRYPNGSGSFRIFNSPTPKMNNDFANITDYELELKELIGFPNPTNNLLYLNTHIDFELIDLSGRKIANGQNENVIDMSNLQTGIYLLLSEGYKPLKIIRSN